MKKELISEEQFRKATQLERFKFAASALMGISGIKAINALYEKADKTSQQSFIESIFQSLAFKFELDENQLKRIPSEGPFITISNHPFGALDGLLLLYLIQKRRPDYKLMANFILREIEPIKNEIIPVNPFENKKDLASSHSGVKNALMHIRNGNCLGIFPAGEVSSFQTHSRKIADKQWNRSVIKLIKKAEVPVIPIYFKGSNSLLFQLLGFIHPSLRTIALPGELLKKRPEPVQVRIGRAITIEQQKDWTDIQQFGRFLRAKTYSLDSSIQVKPFFSPRYKLSKSPKEIIGGSPKEELIREIGNIESYKLFSQAEFDLYIAPAKSIPNILQEIGRLREITFREVGEGTNKSIDLDEFDLYYHHLFLWDRENHRLVGAYRIGKGNDIFKAYGKKGFYIHSLFKIKKKFNPILKQSLEMGRSFIVKDYQQKRLPLFLLWRGILIFTLKNKEYRYLIGPVSISGSYTSLSRSLIVEFIRRYYYNTSLAELVEARTRFKINFSKIEGEKLLEKLGNDFHEIDHIISDCEPNHMPMPVLVKKYLKQNAKIIGFNVDPDFNNAVDGFIILDLLDLSEEMKSSLMAEL